MLYNEVGPLSESQLYFHNMIVGFADFQKLVYPQILHFCAEARLFMGKNGGYYQNTGLKGAAGISYDPHRLHLNLWLFDG